ncbi:MAG: hypothetical protein WCK35_06925 [Chloroflexota bacterium]
MQAAPQFAEQIMVMLEPDVAKIFTSAKEVNQALRALISSIPKHPTTAGKKPVWVEPGNEVKCFQARFRDALGKIAGVYQRQYHLREVSSR